MFERNRVDNRTETLIAIEVQLADGSKIAGRAVLAAGKGVHKLLEGDEGFIYLDVFDGDGMFVPKADIRGLKVLTGIKPQYQRRAISNRIASWDWTKAHLFLKFATLTIACRNSIIPTDTLASSCRARSSYTSTPCRRRSMLHFMR
jgi:hypothetical protein